MGKRTKERLLIKWAPLEGGKRKKVEYWWMDDLKLFLNVEI